MKIKRDSITIILVGKWNKFIFTPAWVNQNLLQNQNQPWNVEFAINLDAPPRFSCPASNIRIIPSEDKLIFTPLHLEGDALQRVEDCARNTVTILSHTPVASFGENFSYEEANVVDLMENFDFTDNTRLVRFGVNLINKQYTRTLSLDGKVINFTVSEKDGKVTFDFNFHYVVTNATEAAERMPNTMTANKQLAERLLHDVYGLNLEEERQ